jgi:chemotaxis protein CheD
MSVLTPAVATVGIGERLIARAPARLAVYGLGSCVVIFVNDPDLRLGGLAHALLPDEPFEAPQHRLGRYVPAAVRSLVADLEEAGADRSRLVAKVAGGASLFRRAPASRTTRTVGTRNVEAALRCLALLDVPVARADVGGGRGRSVVADLNDGSLTSRSVRSGETII